MKKALIVDDNSFLHLMWREALSGRVEVIFASSIEEAKREFALNPDVDAIVVDSCVSGCGLNTVPLIQEFRLAFKGPMLGISDVPLFQQKLVEAGCNYSCEKKFLIVKLCEILGL